MSDLVAMQQQLHHAHQRIVDLERRAARDQALLQRTHAELHAVQATHAWKLARVCYSLRDRVVPPESALYRFGMRVLETTLRQVRTMYRCLRSRDKPGGRLGRSVGLDDFQYRRWIRRHEPTSAELEQQRQQRFACAPLISVVMPVFRPPTPFLHAALASITAQTYGNWEACLADASGTAEVRAVLAEYAARDPRIRIVQLAENRGIAANTNAALAEARGEFVAFMDHDDTLAPFALWAIVQALNTNPAADFLYSDEDKLDGRGRRVDPHFKPDWSPEYLRSLNYICHLTVLQRDLLTRLGGLRSGFDGAQDYDLVLRASAAARHIVHIPQVLYHWRMHAGSTAATVAAKPDSIDAGRRALQSHVDSAGNAATVEHGAVPGIYRTRYELPRQPLVSIIIPNRDQPALLRQCLGAVQRSRYDHVEVLIVENGSLLPATAALYREAATSPTHRVLHWQQPFNYSAVNNFAARHAQGDLLLFLNNDVQAEADDWLIRLVELAVQPGVGAVGAKLLYPERTIQHGGIILGMGGIAGHSHLNFPADAPGYMRRLQFPHNCAAVTAACMLVPRTVFEHVDGFDEGFVLAFGDVDLCLKIRQAGFRIVWTPDATLIHHESKTRGYEDTAAKKLRFAREVDLFRHKWDQTLAAGDPYYSPHFRLDRCDWVLK